MDGSVQKATQAKGNARCYGSVENVAATANMQNLNCGLLELLVPLFPKDILSGTNSAAEATFSETFYRARCYHLYIYS